MFLFRQIYEGFRQYQEKMQKISPIKQRILQFVENTNLSKREFYAKTGISRGTLENPSGITEDIIARFVAVFPNISPGWLLTGDGPMLINDECARESDSGGKFQPGPCQQCAIRDKLIAKQEENIDLLKDKIAELNLQLRDKGKSDNIKQTA